MHIEYVYIYSFILKNALSHNPISKLKSSSNSFWKTWKNFFNNFDSEAKP